MGYVGRMNGEPATRTAFSDGRRQRWPSEHPSFRARRDRRDANGPPGGGPLSNASNGAFPSCRSPVGQPDARPGIATNLTSTAPMRPAPASRDRPKIRNRRSGSRFGICWPREPRGRPVTRGATGPVRTGPCEEQARMQRSRSSHQELGLSRRFRGQPAVGKWRGLRHQSTLGRLVRRRTSRVQGLRGLPILRTEFASAENRPVQDNL